MFIQEDKKAELERRAKKEEEELYRLQNLQKEQKLHGAPHKTGLYLIVSK